MNIQYSNNIFFGMAIKAKVKTSAVKKIIGTASKEVQELSAGINVTIREGKNAVGISGTPYPIPFDSKTNFKNIGSMIKNIFKACFKKDSVKTGHSISKENFNAQTYNKALVDIKYNFKNDYPHAYKVSEGDEIRKLKRTGTLTTFVKK